MPLLILIADDDPGIRLAVSDYLELLGYSVVSASNGEQALEFLKIYHPHLLISDIRMPVLDGYGLVKKVRQRPEFRLLPVIFLTERANIEERIKGYQAGCDSYLPKPFQMEELGAIIRNLLERSQIIQTELHFSARESRSDTETVDNEPTLVLNLTQREQEVLEFLAQGLSNIEIAQEIYLSPRTVEKYVSSLLRKTESSNRAELVRFVLENKLIN